MNMSYGLNSGWGGPIGGIYRVAGGDLLRDILQFSSRARIDVPSSRALSSDYFGCMGDPNPKALNPKP